MTVVVAECMACGTRLATRQADGGIQGSRRCACPWPPRAGAWAMFPNDRSKSNDPMEVVKAWKE